MEIFVKSPMHPDLFNGESPIMRAIKVGEDKDAFCVNVSGVCYDPVLEILNCYVLAVDEEDAQERALDLWARKYKGLYEEITEEPNVDSCELLDSSYITDDIAEKLQQSCREAA